MSLIRYLNTQIKTLKKIMSVHMRQGQFIFEGRYFSEEYRVNLEVLDTNGIRYTLLRNLKFERKRAEG